jgi:hypothetical protein
MSNVIMDTFPICLPGLLVAIGRDRCTLRRGKRGGGGYLGGALARALNPLLPSYPMSHWQCGRAHDCQASRRFKSRLTDDVSTCNPICSCGLCGYLGRNTGEGVKLGSNPRKADETHSLSQRIQSNQSTLAAKRTVKGPLYPSQIFI